MADTVDTQDPKTPPPEAAAPEPETSSNDGQTIDVIAAVKTEDLKEGITISRDYILWKKGENIKACRNKCKHSGGSFVVSDVEDTVRCTNHGWCLNVATMTYTNPAGCDLRQPQLTVETEDPTQVELVEILPPVPWGELQPRGTLEPGEFTSRHMSHACAIYTLGDKRIATDPWVYGPAMSTGWWLTQVPPDDWVEAISSVDVIYISHNHTDHINVFSMEAIYKANPDVKIVCPAFQNTATIVEIKRTPFTNVHVVPFGQWQPLGEHGRYMILVDFSGRDDSALVVEYKGHRILNTTDCANPNNDVLPPCDLQMSSFAGGASGFPVCWEKTEDEIASIVARNRKKLAMKNVGMLKASKAKVFLPFAGYFTEAHPDDAEIQRINLKNSAQDLVETVAKWCPNVRTVCPDPGMVIDMATLEVTDPGLHREPQHDFAKFDAIFETSLEDEGLKTLDGVQKYFDWAGYHGDALVVHISETNRDFSVVHREFWVDFSGDRAVVSDTEPDLTDKRLLNMKVRQHTFRYALIHGINWEDLSIGFQCRFSRTPDVYNFGFWMHFQNGLPETPCVW